MILSALYNGTIRRESVENVDFDLVCDVLCVGAGSAGIYLADSAARQGAKVILLEAGRNIGGMHVCGNVISYYLGARGGAHEMDREACLCDDSFLSPGEHWEQKQITLTKRLNESGVTLLCRYTPIGLYVDGNRVVGVRALGPEGIVSIGAGITADATSDGHLIRMLDVKKRYGRQGVGDFVPFTVRAQFVKDGELRHSNRDSGVMDHYDNGSFSRRTVQAHANCADLLLEGEFVNLALHTGVREALTFEGEERLSYEDILLGRIPPRVLFYAYSDLDRHGYDRSRDEELFQSFWVVANLATAVLSIPVPIGAVVPKGMRGIVTAGRCLSTDTYAQSAVRMNRDMFRMGQCMGVLAAMASENGDIMAVDYDEYLARVRPLGCYSGYSERSIGFDNTYGQYLRRMEALGREPDPKYEGLSQSDSVYEPISLDVEENLPSLGTDSPGAAIWSLFLGGDQYRERVYDIYRDAEDGLLRGNCALALGLMGDSRALPELRRMVRERDHFFFTDNRRSNQFRSASALCLIGRLGEPSDIELIMHVLDDGESSRPMYSALKPDYLYYAESGLNFLYFTMLSHACASLEKLYRRYGLPIDELKATYEKLFVGDKTLRRLTDAPVGSAAYDEAIGLINEVLRSVG